MATLQEPLTAIKYHISRHKRLSLFGVVVLFYFIIKFLHRDNTDYMFDLNDGKSTTGFGITRGGTGNLGYQKNSRLGGLPPSARKSYVNKDPIIYDDYDIDSFEEENFEFFDKDKNKIVIILGANQEGGVNRWKGPNEWSIERSSIVNKRYYAKLHGYDLVIKDLTKFKKYSNDHREGWQKFDIIKDVFQEYNNGDWFWYLDLKTLIMEPEYSIEELIFETFNETASRDLSYFNPNELKLSIPFINYNEPINLIMSQDCGGFNLNSFFIKKTKWSSTLFDILFDPVVYSQKYDKWTNGEKNALEYFYNEYGWIRSRIGFVPTRLISSLPQGACPDFKGDERFFYNETQRDFLVNMNGCEYNRNCWDEMELFKKISKDLHSTWFKRIFG